MILNESYLRLLELMGRGGEVMWLIAAVAIILWALVFERCWYVFFGFKKDVKNELEIWQTYSNLDKRSLYYLRDAVVGRMQQKIEGNLNLLKTLILLCPLLGLLGTVTGMITVFDVISFDNMGDLKLMAGGISKATIPTMASMVISISGIFAHGMIKKMIDSKKRMIRSLFDGVSNA
ncbi:MAG: biopolymer transport protein ExbB [Gammaproteobacteria bacterium]|jgi:biopolymer transport protein ExbB